MALAGAERIFRLMDEEPELDEGYVTLVNAKEENGKLTETKERTGKWAWKHTHQADGSVDYRELQGRVVFEHVDFGYNPDKIVLHDVSLFAEPGQKIAFVGSTGAGKTTITVLVASYLHYVKGYNVAVVDCDFPQYSIHDMRRRDMDMTMKDDHYKAMAYELFKRLAKKAYPIVCSKPGDAPDTAARLTASGASLDFVFFDLPGTINLSLIHI